MCVKRRLFLVPVGPNNRGKGTIIRGLISHGKREDFRQYQKGQHLLRAHPCDDVNAYIFVRSFMESEKTDYGDPYTALQGNDPDWYKRDLVVFPNHIGVDDATDTQKMVACARSAGFDPICIPIIMYEDDYNASSTYELGWSEIWTIRNEETLIPNADWQSKCIDIGKQLWWRVSKEILGS